MDELSIDENGYVVLSTTYTASGSWTKPQEPSIGGVGIELWVAGGSAIGSGGGLGSGGSGGTAAPDITWGGAGGGTGGGTGIQSPKLFEPKLTTFPIIYYDITQEDMVVFDVGEEEEKGWERPKPVAPVNPRNRKKILFD